MAPRERPCRRPKVTASGAAARFINHACGTTANLRVEEFFACAEDSVFQLEAAGFHGGAVDTVTGKTVPLRVPPSLRSERFRSFGQPPICTKGGGQTVPLRERERETFSNTTPPPPEAGLQQDLEGGHAHSSAHLPD